MKALIFDVDGTLAETEEFHRAAFNAAFEEFGLDWHWHRPLYLDLLRTTGGKERIARYAASLGVQVPVPEVHAAKNRHFVAHLREGIALRPGIRDLLAEARASGLRLAVATTTSAGNVEALTRAAFGSPASDVFEVIAAGDAVARKKPAPDVYILALDMLGLAADQAVAFEDSRNGVLAARAAGLATVLSRGIYTRHEPDAGATLTVGEFTELGGVDGLRNALAGTVGIPVACS